MRKVKAFLVGLFLLVAGQGCGATMADVQNATDVSDKIADKLDKGARIAGESIDEYYLLIAVVCDASGAPSVRCMDISKAHASARVSLKVAREAVAAYRAGRGTFDQAAAELDRAEGAIEEFVRLAQEAE